MKKTIAIMLAAVLCLGIFAGCGNKAESPVSAPSEPASAEADGKMILTQKEAVSKEKYLKESAFDAFLSHAEPCFIIPGLNEAAIPQGMGYSEKNDTFYISSYYSGEMPSVISAVKADSGELTAEYFLYNGDGSAFNSHVGGLAVNGDTLYVSAKLDNDGSYSVASIALSELPESGSHEISVKTLVPVPVSPSFMNCSGGYLWLGNFYYPSADYNLSAGMNYTTNDLGCYVLGYRTDRTLEAGIEAVPDVILAVTDRIQGFNICSDGSVLLSQSYGRKNNSSLLRYELDLKAAPDTELEVCGTKVGAYILDETRLVENCTAMPMTEALCSGPDGKTLVLFESGAVKYQDGRFRTDKVWKLDF